jgi:uncharacterized RDD family membrane protein YckC
MAFTMKKTRWRNIKKEKKYQKISKDNINIVYAGFWARVLALVIDTFMILTPVTVIIGMIFGYESLKNPELNPEAGIFQMGMYAIITVLFWVFFNGQTPGKKALEMSVVDSKSFTKPNLFQSVIRYVGYFISIITLIGFFVGLFRKDKRTLHDLLSRTAVIYLDKSKI